MTFPTPPKPSAAQKRILFLAWINAGCGALVTALLIAGAVPRHEPPAQPQVVAVVVAEASAGLHPHAPLLTPMRTR